MPANAYDTVLYFRPNVSFELLPQFLIQTTFQVLLPFCAPICSHLITPFLESANQPTFDYRIAETTGKVNNIYRQNQNFIVYL